MLNVTEIMENPLSLCLSEVASSLQMLASSSAMQFLTTSLVPGTHIMVNLDNHLITHYFLFFLDTLNIYC